jgi:tight adherence protein B
MQTQIIAALVFTSSILAVFGIYYGMVLSRESVKSEVRRRLHSIAMKEPSGEAMPSILKDQLLSEIPFLNKMLYRFSPASGMERLIDQSGVKLNVGSLTLLTAVLFGAGIAGGLISHRGLLIGIVFGLVLAASPYVFLAHKRKKRQMKFTEQFPDALDMIARSLRAGHSFVSAMQIVYQEMAEPVSKLFRIAYDEQNFGLSLPDALDNMTVQMPSIDLEFFVTSVKVQREAGGNLAEIFEKLGVTIRERLKVYRQLRVYTAQGRVSGYILAALPFALALALMVLNPDYLKLLVKTQTGMYMTIGALALQVIGFFIIRRIIAIRV